MHHLEVGHNSPIDPITIGPNFQRDIQVVGPSFWVPLQQSVGESGLQQKVGVVILLVQNWRKDARTGGVI